MAFAVPHAVAAPINSSDLSTKKGIQSYIDSEAEQQGANSEIPKKIVQLESNYVIGAVGDHGAAHCLAQFHKETFYRMQKLSSDNPMYRWGDERACIRLLIWGLQHGYGNEWSTYQRAVLSIPENSK